MLLRRTSLVWSSVALAPLVLLASACNGKPEGMRGPGPVASMGLPPLSGAEGGPPGIPDAGQINPPLTDAAALPLADAALPDVPSADGPEDVAAPALDAHVAPPDIPPQEVTLTPASDADICSSTSAMAKPLPVDIFFLIDRSGSMTISVGTLRRDSGASVSRWESIVEALTNFAQAPASAGLQIGLGYFPGTTSFDECSPPQYSTPSVPIGELPGVANDFISSLMRTFPDGGTPTLPGIEGAIQYARQRETMLGRRTAIALATDGQPNSCNSSLQTVSDAVRMAAMQGIYTFVIGVGNSLQVFNSIAAAGGTNTAYLVENATPNELGMAFRNVQMQAAALACSYMVPPPPAGQTIDSNRVGVRFTPNANPIAAFDIPMVPTRADCGPTGGYFFDDLATPTSVTLCEASCKKVNTSGEGSVSVVFGCRQR
jgi:hypothetical protein